MIKPQAAAAITGGHATNRAQTGAGGGGGPALDMMQAALDAAAGRPISSSELLDRRDGCGRRVVAADDAARIDHARNVPEGGQDEGDEKVRAAVGTATEVPEDA